MVNCEAYTLSQSRRYCEVCFTVHIFWSPVGAYILRFGGFSIRLAGLARPARVIDLFWMHQAFKRIQPLFQWFKLPREKTRILPLLLKSW